ncbi:MAG: baseplate J/gp47 family protein [Clostridiales bacterium]|nr:baseplate J/gp47 family protein [Clostridiales bacterium]
MQAPSYEEFVQEMQAAYYEETHLQPDEAGDMGVRLKVLSSQLYALGTYGDYIFRQAFPQSAQGSYLDLHCETQGITRKQAARAQGEVTFGLEEAADTETVIPAGTIVASRENRQISFETTRRAVIAAGSTAAAVPAAALDTGTAYNVAAGEIEIMVTPPAGISYVANGAAFTGGYAEESDEMLRARLLEAMGNYANGFNRASYIRRALQLENVVDASLINRESIEADGRVELIVRTKDGSISSELESQLLSLFGERQMAALDLALVAAAAMELELDVLVYAQEEADQDAVCSGVEDCIRAHMETLRRGQPLSLVLLGRELAGLDGVVDFAFQGLEHRNTIAPGYNQYLALSRLEVTADVW